MPVDPLENFINQNRDAFDAERPADSLWDRIDSDLGAEDKADDEATESDGLLAFITTHRAAFDDAEPPAKLWERILAALAPAEEESGKVVQIRRLRAVRLLRVAAAAVVVLLAGTLFLGRQMGYQAAEQRQMAVLEAIAPDFLEVEDFYQGQIEQAYRQVSEIHEDPTLEADLAAIDEAMEELREELGDVPRDQQAAVVARLIESYQIKLQILERILQRLPKNEPGDENQNDKNHDYSI